MRDDLREMADAARVLGFAEQRQLTAAAEVFKVAPDQIAEKRGGVSCFWVVAVARRNGFELVALAVRVAGLLDSGERFIPDDDVAAGKARRVHAGREPIQGIQGGGE